MTPNNIFGVGNDTLVNGPAASAAWAKLPNRFTRIQAWWPQIEPAQGQFNFTNAPSCNDAIIAAAAGQGRVILFDVVGFPPWVIADWPNRYIHMAAYVVAILTRWPQIQILGCWNEPSLLQPTSQPASVMIPGTATGWVTPLQLMTEYHSMVTCIYNAKMSVNPKAQLNIGKFGGLSTYWTCMLLMKSLGTWAMGDYITWHDYDNQFNDPMVDNLPIGNNPPVLSNVHKVQSAMALFPGKLVGSDEFGNYGITPLLRLQSAVSYRAAGAAMMIDCLLPYPTPVPAPTDPHVATSYGANQDFTPTLNSQLFIEALTAP